MTRKLQQPYFETSMGSAYHGDAFDLLKQLPDNSINLIITSPPFALQRKKEYGNVGHDEYVDWFRQFIPDFYRVLTDDGSFVLDIGGTWIKGKPVRSLYHFRLLLAICETFHLAQDFYWYNPSKLPTPAEWVTVRRIRVKDAVNHVWWFSKSEFPKANNRNVLKPYSDSMKKLIKNGYTPKKRPSGHEISDKFQKDNQGAIPPNLLAFANTESNSYYQRRCRESGIKEHPARFPAQLPEFFINFLTTEDDVVLDPLAGSCVTGEVAEFLNRRWLCFDLVEEYLQGAQFRFEAREEDDKEEVERQSTFRMESLLDG